MTPEKMVTMIACSYLLPDPGGAVVRECLDEIDRLYKALEAAKEELKDEQTTCNEQAGFYREEKQAHGDTKNELLTQCEEITRLRDVVGAIHRVLPELVDMLGTLHGRMTGAAWEFSPNQMAIHIKAFIERDLKGGRDE